LFSGGYQRLPNNVNDMKKRLFDIDAVRGWVMIFMALDHAVLFCYNIIYA
jgi:uncharacterized membrane protein